MRSGLSGLIRRLIPKPLTINYRYLGLVASFCALTLFLWRNCQIPEESFVAMTPRRAFGAAVLHDQVYVVGGWNGAASQLDLVEVFDPAAHQWARAAPLQVARSQHAVIAVDEQLWAIGGWSADHGLVSAVERFSVAQGDWTIVTHLPMPRREPGAAHFKQWLVVAGGFDGSSDADLDGYSNRVEAYDLDQGSWRRLANLAVPRRGLALVAADERLFALGGYTAEGGFTNIVEEYDAARNRWVQLPWAIAPRTWVAPVVIDGAILLAGGYNQSGFLGLVERIDPHTGQLCHPPPLQTPRSWFALAPTTIGLLALGGETADGFTGNSELVATNCE
ncbi:MAG: hypothetical protein DYG89_30590 [Caldilinea sp. CFX5]|nr:hypothetical protein [Caldilinea sp. CFX5]